VKIAGGAAWRELAGKRAASASEPLSSVAAPESGEKL